MKLPDTHGPAVPKKIRSLVTLSSLCVLLAGSGISTAYALTGTINSNAADAAVNDLSGVTSVSGATSTFCKVGNSSGDATQLGVVHVFEIPAALLTDATQQFDTATYSARLVSLASTTRNADLYGLGYRTSPTVLASDSYVGALDGSATLLKDNFLVPGMSASIQTVSDATLVAYLNTQLFAARAAGATSAYVFFHTSPESAVGNWQWFQLGMVEGGGSSIPTLSYATSAIPAPAWVPIPLGGGGWVTGLICDATDNDIYCRTDNGGAFRWVPSTGEWISITDTIVPVTTTNSADLMGIAGLAIDPANTNNLYVAAGGATSSVLHGIYASTDKGATWSAINSSIIVAGNEVPKAFGERLQVDPNNSNILWYGSTQDGLQKGVKSGSTWTWTQIPSTSVPFGAVPSGSKAGVTFVAFDKNGGSPIMYAGVYDSTVGGTTGGVYSSTDSGVTWSKVSGVALATPARGEVAANGTLYVTANGLVAKMPRGGSLSAITPLASTNYRALAVDPNDSTGNTVYVGLSSGGSNSKIWRTSDGGNTWSTQSTNFNNALSIAAQEPDGTPSVIGYWFGAISDLLVRPGNSSELWAGDFFGVARSQNAQLLGGPTGNQAIWYRLQKNQEQTISSTLRNAPTGPELMAGLIDVGGFRYNDISKRPYGSYGNAMKNPVDCANVTGLDFSESNNAIWARVSTNNTAGGSTYYGTGSYTRDGGVNWTAFGEIDRNQITMGAAGWQTWDLTTYLATQKAKGINTVTLLISTDQNSTRSTSVVNFASKENATTTIRPYLLVNGATSLAPTHDAQVYANTPTTPDTNTTGNIGVSFSYAGLTADQRFAYLKFDLSSVGTITSAVLNLYRQSGTPVGTTYPVGIYACANTSWTETAVTWNTRPYPYASATGEPNVTGRYLTAAGQNLSGGRIAISGTNPSQLVWLPFKGLCPTPHYSNDCGVTWSPAAGLPANISETIDKSNPGYTIQQLAADRLNGNFYLALFGQGGSGNHGIYRSTDGGANWSLAGTVTAGTYNVYRAQIMAAPQANDVWVCDDGVAGSTAGGLWRSTNGGTTWSAKLPNITAVGLVSFGKAAIGSSYLYSVYFYGYYSGVKGIYRSDDYGATWVAMPTLPTDANIQGLAGDRQTPASVFIGTGGRGMFQGQ
jgi:hypothetical protein